MKIALLLLVPYKTSQTESHKEELVLAYKEAECPSERESLMCVLVFVFCYWSLSLVLSPSDQWSVEDKRMIPHHPRRGGGGGEGKGGMTDGQTGANWGWATQQLWWQVGGINQVFIDSARDSINKSSSPQFFLEFKIFYNRKYVMKTTYQQLSLPLLNAI